jgi:hypothetical protein
MHRRNFLKVGAGLAAASGIGRVIPADVPDHNWDRYDFGPGPQVRNRLNQGPFGIDQDEGLLTVTTTTPSDQHVKNFGVGMVGYMWEESGPSLAVRQGKETLEQQVEKMAALPFVDVLYIRCDWRDVQSQPGRLDLMPIWKLTLDAAKTHDLRVGFRVQLSNPGIQPKQLAMPDFLRGKVPLCNIGGKSREQDFDLYEPQYDHPEFQKAFHELTELLAAEFDDQPIMEFMDLMMYGFWGEGHTGGHPAPFRDYVTAERTFVGMTELQLEAFRKIPLAVNTQPDSSHVGNRQVQDLVVRAGGWLRSDSIIPEEPIQIEELGNRPPWLACILEDGSNRHYLPAGAPRDTDEDDGGYRLDDRYREVAGLHALDIGANYWALWTEADNIRRYFEKYPRSLEMQQRRMGYRVRPSWVWQRKRYGTAELILGIVNDGVAGVPGVLGVYVETPDGKVKVGGNLDAGQPYAGKVRQASFVLPTGLDGQEVRLRAEIELKGVRHPVRWACNEPLNPDGSLSVRLGRNDDPSCWRWPGFPCLRF